MQGRPVVLHCIRAGCCCRCYHRSTALPAAAATGVAARISPAARSRVARPGRPWLPQGPPPQTKASLKLRPIIRRHQRRFPSQPRHGCRKHLHPPPDVSRGSKLVGAVAPPVAAGDENHRSGRDLWHTRGGCGGGGADAVCSEEEAGWQLGARTGVQCLSATDGWKPPTCAMKR